MDTLTDVYICPKCDNLLVYDVENQKVTVHCIVCRNFECHIDKRDAPKPLGNREDPLFSHFHI